MKINKKSRGINGKRRLVMNIIIAVLLILCMANVAVADLNVTQEKNGAYLIVATHPVKPLDMIELPTGNSTVKKIYDDAEVIVETVKIQNRTGMDVQAIAGGSDSNVTYFRIYKHIIDTQWDYPQIFVLHANGYAQISPQPPVGMKKVKFGPPIVIGPVITSVIVDPPSLSMEIRYEDKTGANVKIIKVDRKQNIIEYTQNVKGAA
jgi:hypothetical protein